MRGLPGSGKSTIVKQITDRYPSAVVCSADKFMVNSVGIYQYDRSKLTAAHNHCRDQALTACDEGRPVVVDNTNLHRHEMAIYLLAARALSYNVVIVEPRTPWAKDPEELARRSLHNLTAETVQQKLRGFRPFVAQFYGWFLDARDTDYVCRFARRSFGHLTGHGSFSKWYESVVRDAPSDYPDPPQAEQSTESSASSDNPHASPEKAALGPGQKHAEKRPEKQRKRSSADAEDDAHQQRLEEWQKSCRRVHSHQVDTLGVYKSRATLLHVTTKYARLGNRSEMVEYCSSPVVDRSLGSASELCITGFFVTPRTFGARVLLSAKQLRLWGKENEFISTVPIESPEVGVNSAPDENGASKRTCLSDEEVAELSDDDSSDEDGEEEEEEEGEVDRFCPCPADVPGITAHITIGVISGQKAAQAGLDLYGIIEMEREAKAAQSSSPGPVLEEIRIDTGVVRHYRGDSWMFYLDKPVRTEGFFSGNYFS